MPGNVYFKPNSYFRNRVTQLVWHIGKNIVLNITFAWVQYIIVKRIVVRVFIVVCTASAAVSGNSNKRRSCRTVRMQMERIQFMKNAGNNI